MRIGRLFAASMLSVTALAVVLATEVLVPQIRTFLNKTEAIKDVEVFGVVLLVSQQVAGHRAPYLTPLFQDGPATPAQLDAITKATEASDAAFAKARTVLGAFDGGAAILDGLNQAATRLADLRAQADRAVSLPRSGRDQAVVNGFLPGLTQVGAAIEPLLNRLENRVASADTSLTVLLNVARAAQDLRISAGARVGAITPAISGGRQLTVAEFALIDRNQGRVEAARERIESDIDQLDSPVRLTSAMKDAFDDYFRRAVPEIDKQLAAARGDGKFSFSPGEFANAVVPSVLRFLRIRDAALAEAAERAAAARDGALMMLALAAAVVMALFGVLAGVTVMLRRRLIGPLATLTNVVGDLAAGRHEVTIPASGRDDEIGSMAGSLQVFKEALIAKKASDEAAAAEADAKIKRGQRVDRITSDFEAMIGEIVNVVSSASTELEASAGTLTATAERSEELTTTVAAASEEASTNVQSVASATEEMASSVNEISRQVQDSARIATEAVVQAQTTNDRVGELARAASRIGDVVELISSMTSPILVAACDSSPTRSVVERA